jgi:hypothetical protein
MFASITHLWQDRITRSGLLLGAVLLILLSALIIGRGDLGNPGTVLHYNVYFGIDVYGPGSGLLWHIVVAGLIWLGNLIIAGFTIEREKLAARLVAWFGVVLTGIIFTGTALILWYRVS